MLYSQPIVEYSIRKQHKRKEVTQMEQINTVQDLINALQLVENKELPVFVYSEDFDIDLQEISLIDYDISDRVDINVKSANHRVK